MSNPNRQKPAKAKLSVSVKLPPVPRSLGLDTPGVESRISIADVPPAQLRRIGEQWIKELMATAETLRKERVAK